VLLNRTTFGRRTIAVGGNPEAARLAGINVKRHTMFLYALAGLAAGIAGVMMLGRTSAGSSTNGQFYELDAIAAVVVGGTLLVGGRGTITGTVFGVLIWIFVLVAALGWILLNRTTFGRRTVAIGGNREAARLAGINVKRHTMYLYALAGLAAGIGGVMMLGRTSAGSSTNGLYYELDAIAAVVVGGTLLAGGRGTIVGTVLGVLIFQVLTNVFTQNNVSSSAQNVAKGVIIVVAVLLQRRIAERSRAGTT